MDLAPAYSRMLQCSDLVCKHTKGNETLTGNLVPVSAVPAKLTGTVMVMQKIAKMPIFLNLKQKGARQGPWENFTVGFTWLKGTNVLFNQRGKRTPREGVTIAFIGE